MASPGGQARPVFVADEDDDTRQQWSAALEAAGFDVVVAADGHEALERLTTTTCSVAVLNSRLPGLDGLAVLQQLRSAPHTGTLPVIMVTAGNHAGDRVAALEAGVTDHLVEPVSVDELVARVRAHQRLQLAWRHVIERRLEERAHVLDALAHVRPAGSVEETAAAVCHVVAGVHGVVAVAALAYVHETGVVPLAVHVADRGSVAQPRPLRAALAQRILAATADGPWVDRSGRIPWTGATMWEALEPAVTAYAPFGPAARPLGALAITASVRPDDMWDVGERLSAVLDFAAVAGLLLGPALEERAERDALSTRIRSLVDSRGFRAVFQPVFRLAPEEGSHEEYGPLVAFEALTRFADGTPPDLQLAEARRAGAHFDLEMAMLEEALKAGRALPRDVLLFLNVSPRFLIDRGHLLDVRALAARNVVLELTEHERVDDYGRLRSAFDQLRPDVRLCVDDVGAGYASLRHVLALAPDFVKLDAEWVHGLADDVARQALVLGMASFAERTGAEIVAEGIETIAELAIVRRLGIRLGQGYVLGRPAAVAPA